MPLIDKVVELAVAKVIDVLSALPNASDRAIAAREVSVRLEKRFALRSEAQRMLDERKKGKP